MFTKIFLKLIFKVEINFCLILEVELLYVGIKSMQRNRFALSMICSYAYQCCDQPYREMKNFHNCNDREFLWHKNRIKNSFIK